MKLVRTSVLSAIITASRIGASFVASKIVAVYAGPAGVAMIGQFYNFLTVALNFGNGAISTGIVKFTAEFGEQRAELRSLLSTALRVTIISSAIVSLILWIFSKTIARLLFESEIYHDVIKLLASTIILYALNTAILSILNGLKQITLFAVINCSASFLSLILTYLLVHNYRIKGALVALVLSQTLLFFLSLIFIRKQFWFRLKYFSDGLNRQLLRSLGSYSLMAVVAAVGMPVAQMILRGVIIDHSGLAAAGYWQGMMRISDGYLMVVTISLSTYFIPKFSSLTTDTEIRAELFNGLKFILPAVLVSCVVIFLFRELIIKILFTKEFLEMKRLFLYQLAGDFFKIIAYLLVTLMVSKKMTKAYIVTEILFNVGYVSMGYILIRMTGLSGVTIAFAVTYFICVIFLLLFFKRLLFPRYGT
ncbi:O-antigen translocase [Pedobacter sp. SYP-B3415]|uniref:O-antigen translocase n=1 Tax=Pedobacter sp. SYP-B3415 TaxID=2496641 RepID=UPI0013ED6D92|nr:O-antigen translocase [Pedobacter sp. SYP-B3415]